MSYKPFVLMYHAVSPATDRVADPFLISVSPATLDRQFRFLARRGLRGVSMRELLAAPDPSRLVGLTFDDGYTDFHTEALPVLQRHGFTASVYVVVDRIGAVNDWEEYGPVRSVMDLNQVRACAAAGMEVGSHGSRHAHLAGASPDVLAAEVVASKEKLAGLLGAPVDGYCYAYGELDRAAVAAVREAGYDYGCAIWRNPDTGRYALPRSYIGERDGALRLQAKRYRFKVRGGPVSLAHDPTRTAAPGSAAAPAPAGTSAQTVTAAPSIASIQPVASTLAVASTKQTEPAQPTELTQPIAAAQSNASIQPVASTQTIASTEQTEPAQPTGLTQPIAAAQSNASIQPVASTQPAASADQTSATAEAP